ncbi:hypothetical protein ACGFWI_24365 [Streptomyces sp. NPDC048434]|uniref:hypothetical protein n=1 Tax=Streptomyces sp. NPDC048434 TaxID=3365549 RepID=UPI0037167EA1
MPTAAEVTTGAGKFRADALAMPAHAFLAVVRADEHAHHPAPEGLVPLNCNGIQRLFTTLVSRPLHDVADRLRWSAWRRCHQARAQGRVCLQGLLLDGRRKSIQPMAGRLGRITGSRADP